MPIASDTLLRNIVRDEGLTRGLGDVEARMLVDWVIDWAELLAEAARTDSDTQVLVNRLCRRAKAIGRFVLLWNRKSRGAATQLAAAEQFTWPLPTRDDLSAPDLMEHILNWEREKRR